MFFHSFRLAALFVYMMVHYVCDGYCPTPTSTQKQLLHNNYIKFRNSSKFLINTKFDTFNNIETIPDEEALLFGGSNKNTIKSLSDPPIIARKSKVPILISKSNKAFVDVVKSILLSFYGDRYYARFAALETIARVPYFSYTSVLHLYETLGWFRRKEFIKIHFAESWNELHHLLIMESLGGSDLFQDRFIAQHIAFFYYWIVVLVYMVNPAVAYDLNKHVERHAFQTYDDYLTSHGDYLKSQAAPEVAVDYYEKGDLYLFDAFHYTGLEPHDHALIDESMKRRPKIDNLYDVFVNIRADEEEHANTMERLEIDVESFADD